MLGQGAGFGRAVWFCVWVFVRGVFEREHVHMPVGGEGEVERERESLKQRLHTQHAA